MRRSQSGFTLIELLIVISIIGVLAAVLVPAVIESREQTYVDFDKRQLSRHYGWIELYRSKHNRAMPSEGGYRFVMSTWTSGVVPHSVENLDFYFTPGARDSDPDYMQARETMQLGENPWPTLDDTSSYSTHYVGRAREHLRSSTQRNQAWMASDNEGVWTLPDGSVNILLSDGNVRTYSYPDLRRLFGLGELTDTDPIQTWGENSPIPECQNLAN